MSREMGRMFFVTCTCLLAGCATICSNTKYFVPVDCNEMEASVEVYRDNVLVALLATPSLVKLSSRGGFFYPATYRFEFSKKGFSTDVKERLFQVFCGKRQHDPAPFIMPILSSRSPDANPVCRKRRG